MSLIVRDVSHAYRGDRDVLSGVSLSIGRGELVAITGPSGSGKSTLLAIIGGLLSSDAGVVELDDQPIRPGSPMLASQISWVFQGSNALLRRSVIDNVSLRGLAVGMPRATAVRRARQALRTVGMSAAAAVPAKTLSGGELQRICIARALVGRPSLICADEPTGNLDAKSTALVVQALTHASAHASTLIATHDAAVARACDREVHINDGLVEVVR